MKARNRHMLEAVESEFGTGTIKSANEYSDGDLELFVPTSLVERIEQFLIWEADFRADSFRVHAS